MKAVVILIFCVHLSVIGTEATPQQRYGVHRKPARYNLYVPEERVMKAYPGQRRYPYQQPRNNSYPTGAAPYVPALPGATAYPSPVYPTAPMGSAPMATNESVPYPSPLYPAAPYPPAAYPHSGSLPPIYYPASPMNSSTPTMTAATAYGPSAPLNSSYPIGAYPPTYPATAYEPVPTNSTSPYATGMGAPVYGAGPGYPVRPVYISPMNASVPAYPPTSTGVESEHYETRPAYAYLPTAPYSNATGTGTGSYKTGSGYTAPTGEYPPSPYGYAPSGIYRPTGTGVGPVGTGVPPAPPTGDATMTGPAPVGSSEEIQEAEPGTVFGGNIILTNLGPLKGTILTSRGGFAYFAFLGIPYARVVRRFQPAQPAQPWGDRVLLDATKYGPVCTQVDPTSVPPNITVIGQDDCLSLNVFFPPAARCPGTLPVWFHIHGGSFLTGAGKFYDPVYIMDGCVVFVSINYRLGAFGWLTTRDNQIPGNLGLKDALIALRWVRDNIRSFRGDPNRVTINGISSGASMVMHFLVASQAAGLFQQAIAQSGSARVPLGIIRNATANAFELGRAVGCTGTTTAALRVCLEGIPSAQIALQQGTITSALETPKFGPVIEPVGAANAFQTVDPYDLLLNCDVNKVPLIHGVVRDEGFLHAIPILSNATAVDLLNSEWLFRAPILYNYNYLGMSNATSANISNSIRNFYLNGGPIGANTTTQFSNSLSDRYYYMGLNETDFLYSRCSFVYEYVMTYQGSWSFSQLFGLPAAVTHGDDIRYLFKSYDFIPEPTGRDLDFSKIFVELWTSFVTTGYPTALPSGPERWRTFQFDDAVTLILDNPSVLVRNQNAARLAFWTGLNLRSFPVAVP